jgi:hypothetical protein
MQEEKKILEIDGVEAEDSSTINPITRPFDPKKIDITTKQMILEAIFRRLRENEIDLNTYFQRNMDLWNKTQQSRLIESILLSLPLPAFYFDGSDDNKWLIVDGLQRLSTFKNYIIEKNFKLQNLEFLQQFDGYGFNELPRELQRRIEEHEITVYIINPGTPGEVKFNLFRRINTGGLMLNAQEIRHTINQGIPTRLIAELAELDNFKKYKINPKRMLDRDFVTRFLAFYINGPEKYKPDLDTFLNDSMAALKELSDKKREQIKADFEKAVLAAGKIFGQHAFRKRYHIDGRKNPLNKALFETWTVALAKLQNDELKKVTAREEALNRLFIDAMNNDKDFEKAITQATGDIKRVKKRFSVIKGLIEKVLK